MFLSTDDHLNGAFKSPVRLAWVLAILHGVRGLHCNSTLAGKCVRHVALDLDVSTLPPVASPRVPHEPIVNAVLCAVPNGSHTVVKGRPTFPGEDTLKFFEGNK